MMIPARVLAGLQAGTMDRAFRRWERPRVRAGGSQRTAIGVIGFEAVEVVERDDLDDEDAVRAGFASLAQLLAFVDRRTDRPLFRVRLRLIGPDPRVELRATVPDDDDHAEIERRLERLDRASRHGPWTHAVLAAIGARPGVPAIELATSFGREQAALQARRPQTQGARPDREPAAGLPAVAEGRIRAGADGRAALTPPSARRYHAQTRVVSTLASRVLTGNPRRHS